MKLRRPRPIVAHPPRPLPFPRVPVRSPARPGRTDRASAIVPQFLQRGIAAATGVAVGPILDQLQSVATGILGAEQFVADALGWGTTPMTVAQIEARYGPLANVTWIPRKGGLRRRPSWRP